MGRPLTVTRVGRFTKRMNFIEELRAALPVSQYLQMLHEAAVSGRIPKFDPQTHSRLPEAQQDAVPLTEADRGKLLQYLIDKSMPTYRQVDAPEAAGAIDVDDLSHATDADFSQLSTEQLRQIAVAANQLADSPNRQLAAPDPAACVRAELAADLPRGGSPPV